MLRLWMRRWLQGRRRFECECEGWGWGSFWCLAYCFYFDDDHDEDVDDDKVSMMYYDTCVFLSVLFLIILINHQMIFF